MIGAEKLVPPPPLNELPFPEYPTLSAGNERSGIVRLIYVAGTVTASLTWYAGFG
jgi:hypothetical protein